MLQPRLIAGVSVAHVPSPATGKQTKKPIIQFCILQAVKSRTTTRPKNKTNFSIALIKMLQTQCLLALFWGRAMNKGNT